MNHFHRILTTALLLALVCVSSSLAQSTGEPAKLTKMRQIYEQELAKLKQPILKKLVTDLAALEQKFTKENKLEEAVKARNERVRIETTLAKLLSAAKSRPVASAKPGAPKKPTAEMKEFTIPMSQATLQGRLKRPSSGSYISNWVTTSCQATWSGGQIIPGFYDVYIDYDTYYYRGGGELKFEELGQDFHCVIPPNHGRRTIKVGTFKLGTALGMTIKALSKNRYGILRLHGVGFRPSAQQ